MKTRRTRSVAAGLLLALVLAAANVAVAAESDLVIARPGKLPIILTAPHGGTSAIGLMRERTSGVRGGDLNTLEMAEAVARRVSQLLGAAPYLVAARFARKYIDANRPADEAYEDAAAKPVYDAYHARIREYVDAVKTNHPKGALLIDVHGQGADPGTIHRGTANGRTVAKLVEKHGAAAITGKDSIFGVLQAKGRTVFPPNTPPITPPEDARYNGGHTVRFYGSNAADGIDAIQVEIGSNLRRDLAFADDLAEAIAAFYKAYLE